MKAEALIETEIDTHGVRDQITKRASALFGLGRTPVTIRFPGLHGKRTEGTKETKRTKAGLTFHQCTEISARNRPVIEARVGRGWWIFRRTVEYSVYGGGWLARCADRKAVRAAKEEAQ